MALPKIRVPHLFPSTPAAVRKWLVSILLFLVAWLFRKAYLQELSVYLLYPDTAEYFEAARRLAAGQVDLMRMPVYSLFMAVISWLTGREIGSDAFVEAVAWAQRFLSSVGVVCLYHAMRALWQPVVRSENLSGSPGIVSAGLAGLAGLPALLAALVCAVHPAIVNWDFLILTESLTLFLYMMLFCAAARYLRGRSTASLVAGFLLSGVLLFIKPFYLPLPLMLLGLLGIWFLPGGNWRTSLRHIVLAGSLVVFIYTLLGGYVILNGRQNGYYGITGVSGINSFGKILQYRMVELGEDGLIKDRVLSGKQPYWVDPNPLGFALEHGYDQDNYAQLKTFAGDIIRKYPFRFVMATARCFLGDMRHYSWMADYCARVYVTGDASWPAALYRLLGGSRAVNRYQVLYGLLLLQLAAIVLVEIRRRKKCSGAEKDPGTELTLHPGNSRIRILVFTLILFQCLMTLVGAHGEYHRLMAPVYFLIIYSYMDLAVLSAVWITNHFRAKKEPRQV